MINKSKKISLLLVCLVVLFAITGCSSGGTENNNVVVDKGSVEGYVYKPIGVKSLSINNSLNLKASSKEASPDGYEPLKDASVIATGSDSVATTNDKGYYRIDGVKVGKQTITIKKEGIKNLNLSVEIFKDKISSVNEDNSITNAEKKDWTFLVYIGGDNNLSSAALNDINEMETVGSDENINIIVKADYSKEFSDIDGGYCYYIEKDNDITKVTSPLIHQLPEIDSGSPKELSNFIDWSTKRYPAEKYALVLWNHGSGWRSSDVESKGISFDDVSGNNISTIELKDVLTDSNADIDLIGFDACLMGSLEVAYQLKDQAKVMVASELNEPNDGWPYDTILADLQNNSQKDIYNLGDVIVDKYVESYNDYDVNMSAIDLSRLSKLTDSLDNGIEYLLKKDFKEINYDYTLDEKGGRYYENMGYVDLIYILEDYSNFLNDSKFNESVENIKSEYQNAIYSYGENLVYYSDLDLNGLSVQLYNTDLEGIDDFNYTDLDFAIDTKWYEFMNDLNLQ